MRSSSDELAARIVKLERELRDLQSTPQLGSSSIEDGQVREYTAQGQLVSQIGRQYDGTHGSVSLGGPVPPTPTPPSVASSRGTLLVRWDGAWAGGSTVVAPMDFTRVEVHVGSAPDVSGILFDTLRGTIESARGGEVVVVGLPPDTDHWVRLTSRTASGGFSPPSDVVGPVRVALLTPSDVGIDLAAIGGTTIFYGTEDPAIGLEPPAIGDLWLRETGTVGGVGQYKTLRWDGTAWSPAADQGIGSALAEAIAAQQAADDASALAQAVRTEASRAQAAADSALSRAGDAQASADGKVRTFFQATPPTGMVVGDVGDLWFDTGVGNRMSSWSGTAWVVSADQRIAQAVTDVAAASSAAGSAQSTADRKITTFYASAAPASTGRTTGDLWVNTTGGLNVLSRWDGSAWVAVRDAGIVAAQNAANAAGTVADGRAQVFAQATPPTGLTASMKGLWFDTSNGNRAYTWTGTAWTPRALGNGVIQPKSLVASDVVATGTVSAALLEAVLVLATTIVAGDANGTHARMTPTGFYVFRPDANGDGQPDQVVSLGGNGSDYFGITDASANLLAAIDQTGRGTFAGLSVTEEPVIMGRKFSTYLNGAGSAVGFGQFSFVQNNIVGEYGIFEVAFVAAPGRMYGIEVTDLRWASNTGTGRAVFLLRDTSRAGQPEVYRKEMTQPSAFIEGQDITYSWYNPPAGIRSVCLSVAASNGGAVAVDAGDIKMTVVDRGPLLPNVAQPNTLGGTAGGARDVTVVQPPPRVQYSEQIEATGSRSYNGDGNPMSNAGVYQGYYGPGGNGNTKGIVIFPDLTARLAGAVVDSVEVYLYAEHWFANAGGTAVIGFHGHTGSPPTWSGPIAPDQVRSGGWPKPGGRWVNLSGFSMDNWRTGAYRGVVVGPGPSTSTEFYGRFADAGAGPGYKPLLRIAYTK